MSERFWSLLMVGVFASFSILINSQSQLTWQFFGMSAIGLVIGCGLKKYSPFVANVIYGLGSMILIAAGMLYTHGPLFDNFLCASWLHIFCLGSGVFVVQILKKERSEP